MGRVVVGIYWAGSDWKFWVMRSLDNWLGWREARYYYFGVGFQANFHCVD